MSSVALRYLIKKIRKNTAERAMPAMPMNINIGLWAAYISFRKMYSKATSSKVEHKNPMIIFFDILLIRKAALSSHSTEPFAGLVASPVKRVF